MAIHVLRQPMSGRAVQSILPQHTTAQVITRLVPHSLPWILLRNAALIMLGLTRYPVLSQRKGKPLYPLYVDLADSQPIDLCYNTSSPSSHQSLIPRCTALYSFIGLCCCRELLFLDFPLRRRVRFLRVGGQSKSRRYVTGDIPERKHGGP